MQHQVNALIEKFNPSLTKKKEINFLPIDDTLGKYHRMLFQRGSKKQLDSKDVIQPRSTAAEASGHGARNRDNA